MKKFLLKREIVSQFWVIFSAASLLPSVVALQNPIQKYAISVRNIAGSALDELLFAGLNMPCRELIPSAGRINSRYDFHAKLFKFLQNSLQLKTELLCDFAIRDHYLVHLNVLIANNHRAHWVKKLIGFPTIEVGIGALPGTCNWLGQLSASALIRFPRDPFYGTLPHLCFFATKEEGYGRWIIRLDNLSWFKQLHSKQALPVTLEFEQQIECATVHHLSPFLRLMGSMYELLSLPFKLWHAAGQFGHRIKIQWNPDHQSAHETSHSPFRVNFEANAYSGPIRRCGVLMRSVLCIGLSNALLDKKASKLTNFFQVISLRLYWESCKSHLSHASRAPTDRSFSSDTYGNFQHEYLAYIKDDLSQTTDDLDKVAAKGALQRLANWCTNFTGKRDKNRRLVHSDQEKTESVVASLVDNWCTDFTNKQDKNRLLVHSDKEPIEKVVASLSRRLNLPVLEFDLSICGQFNRWIYANDDVSDRYQMKPLLIAANLNLARQFFNQCAHRIKVSPTSIIVFKNIDQGIGDRGLSGSYGLTLLLGEIDGIRGGSWSKHLLVGTCADLEGIPKALIRSGRFFPIVSLYNLLTVTNS